MLQLNKFYQNTVISSFNIQQQIIIVEYIEKKMKTT